MIEQRKTAQTSARPNAYSATRPRSNVYINPNYKPPSRSAPPPRPVARPPVPSNPSSVAPKEVVIGGVAFQSSGRSLVRKDCETPATCYCTISDPFSVAKAPPSMSKPQPIARGGFLRPRGSTVRPYKPTTSRGHNMTLANTRRPFQSVLISSTWRPYGPLTLSYRSRRVSNKQRKYVDKPCPRFTTTGAWLHFRLQTNLSRHPMGRHICSFLVLFHRCLQSWPYMPLST